MDILTVIVRLKLISNIPVSLANNISTDLLFKILGSSFIQTRKDRGQKLNFWGILCSISVQLERVL